MPEYADEDIVESKRSKDPFARTKNAYLFAAGRILIVLGVAIVIMIVFVKGPIDSETALPIDRLDAPLTQMNMRQLLFGIGALIGSVGALLLSVGALLRR